MGFQDVEFLPPGASFTPHFIKNSGRGESLRTATCSKTVVGGKQGQAPCRILSLKQSFFFVSV